MHRNIKRQHAYRHHHGMTLIEVMIVMGLLGIISALAYPAYNDHLLNSHRRQALIDMARIQLYIDGQSSASQAIATITDNGQCSTFCNTPRNLYHIHISQQAHTYSIIAKPQGHQQQDTCRSHDYKSLTLRSNGEHQPQNCW
ncbi:MAG: type IV pilin protein [Vibrio sp.]